MINPFDPGYYNGDDLRRMPFKAVGKNVQVAKNSTIVGLPNISLGDNVRIDGFCTIIAANSGWLEVGSYVHIGGYCLLSAGEGIQLSDFSGLSQGVKIYTRSDDYSGEHLTNPTVPSEYCKLQVGAVRLGRHVIVGSGAVILPGTVLEEGCSVGALSLVTRPLDAWGVYAGRPVKRIKERSKRLLDLEQQLLTTGRATG